MNGANITAESLPPLPDDSKLSEPLAHPLPASMPPRPRLWPAVLIVVAQILCLVVPPLVVPGTFTQFQVAFLGPMVGSVLFLLWWLFLSRVSWFDRLLGVVAFATAAGIAVVLSDPSFVFGLVMYGLPLATSAWVIWLGATGLVPWSVRRVGLVAVPFLVAAGCATLRLDGVTGGFLAEVSFRWSPTAEERFLATLSAEESEPEPAVAAGGLKLAPGDWPCFRGANRDSCVPAVRIGTAWAKNPPRQAWRRLIGPGWSSLSVVGTHLYTQEQRGEKEVVSCYDTETGNPIWTHEDDTRFKEAVSGAGPRATPTFHDGKLYTLGANGHLNCLDAGTGKKIWSVDIAADSGAKVPIWGFSSSPLVAQGVVTVFAGGPEGKSVLGYAAESGKLVWSAGEGTHSYCSTQLAKLGGVEQLLITTDKGLTSFEPATGKVLWAHEWPTEEGLARVIQPAVLNGSDVLLGTGLALGTRRLRVKPGQEEWTQEEVWTNEKFKPYFNDLVIHKGHLYGFDGIFFTCIELEGAESKWRTRGYGGGQVLLLPEQDLLLVLSETGEVALLEANPQKHTVLGKFKAITGKTWNHPVVAHGKLFVRNGEEMACYTLP